MTFIYFRVMSYCWNITICFTTIYWL